MGLNPIAPTTTALTVTPASPAAAGTTETLKATISPAAAGNVVFKDGHSLIAVFTPTDTTAFAGSGSATLPYQVYATATTITMRAAPNPAFEGLPVVLTASVSPLTATGTVQFKDGTTPLGAPIRVLAGQALLITSALTKGTHNLTAVFTPANPTAFGPSASPPVSVTIQKRP